MQIILMLNSQTHQVIYDIELVIFFIFGVQLFMLFFPHVILECGSVFEYFLTVQALQTIKYKNHTFVSIGKLSILTTLSSLRNKLAQTTVLSLLPELCLQKIKEPIHMNCEVKRSK